MKLLPRFAIVSSAGLLLSCNNSDTAGIYTTLQRSDKVENVQNKATWSSPSAHYNAISPNGRYLLVSSSLEPTVDLFDLRKGQLLETFRIGSRPQGVVISPDDRWGIAISEGEGTVTIIDMARREKVKTIPMGKMPHNGVFTKDGRTVYVTLQGEGKIAVVDMESLEKVDEFVLDGMDTPHNLDLTEDEGTLWIRDFTGRVAAFDLKKKEVLAVIPVSAGHSGIDIIKGGRYVFVGGVADRTVDVIDPDKYAVIKKIEVGPGSHGIRSDRSGDLVYVSVTGTDQIAVIDTHTLTVKEYMDTQGSFPFWIAVSDNP